MMRRPELNEIGRIGPLGPTFFIAVLLFGACGGSPSVSNNNAPTPAPSPSLRPSPLNDFEEALQFIRDGQYTYVWVLSRKDGKPFQPDDSDFLRTNAPQVVDWTRTDDGKKVVAGTNFNLEEGNLEKLRNRYVIEDYSGK